MRGSVNDYTNALSPTLVFSPYAEMRSCLPDLVYGDFFRQSVTMPRQLTERPRHSQSGGIRPGIAGRQCRLYSLSSHVTQGRDIA
jgi:hypothetical protein